MHHKYIVMRLNGEEQIFVFPKSINHNDMEKAIIQIRVGTERNWTKAYFNADTISAGFVSDGVCFGHSETLGLSSRNDIDTKLFSGGNKL